MGDFVRLREQHEEINKDWIDGNEMMRNECAIVAPKEVTEMGRRRKRKKKRDENRNTTGKTRNFKNP